MGGEQSVTVKFQELRDILPANLIDVGIDDSLLRYSGTNSGARLVEYSSNLQEELGSSLPDFIEKAGGALGGFTPVPNAVGLGAFVLSMILQLAFSATMGSQGPSQIDKLRSVFAEEKASLIRDLIVEYLKRYEMHMRDERWLLADSERLETQLSLQLSVLRDSILEDEQMSSRAVKHWVNGAVFHTQVLLHVGRLRRRTGIGNFESAKRAVRGAVAVYNGDVTTILEAYKAYKKKGFSIGFIYSCAYGSYHLLNDCIFRDRDIGVTYEVRHKYCDMNSNAFMDDTFSNHKQLREIESYFSNVQNNLEVLVNQEGTFQITS